MDRPRDVLDGTLAQIFETIGRAVADMFEDGSGNTDAARLGERFQTRRYVHPVAQDVVTFDDHVAEIDAHSETDGMVPGAVPLMLDYRALDLDAGFDGADDGAELD